jgi:hypothetical protein
MLFLILFLRGLPSLCSSAASDHDRDCKSNELEILLEMGGETVLKAEEFPFSVYQRDILGERR